MARIPLATLTDLSGGTTLAAKPLPTLDAGSDGKTLVYDAGTGAWVTKRIPTSLFFPEDYGAVGDGVTDDTVGVQGAVDDCAAASSALATNSAAAVWLTGTKTYLCNAAPRTDRGGNAIIAFPNSLTNVRIEGNGAKILTTRTSDTYSSSFGSPSVIGGPTPEQYVGHSGLPIIGAVTIRDLVVILPKDPKIAGVDLHWCQGEDTKNLTVIANGAVSGAVDTLSTAIYVFGIRHAAGNYGLVCADGVFSNGVYCGHVIHGSHTHFKHVYAGNATVGVAFLGGDGHASVFDYLMTEHCVNHLGSWDPASGAISIAAAHPFYLMAGNWDIEDGSAPVATVYHLLDANSQLTGYASYMRYAGLAVSDVLVRSGGYNLQAIPTVTTNQRQTSLRSDTHANRLAATSYPNLVWYENDTGLLFLGAGAFGWVPINRTGIILKTADQTINNSAALTNDTHLKFPIESSEIWYFKAVLKMTGASTTSDWKTAWSLPAGATVEEQVLTATVATGSTPPTLGSTASAGSVSGTYEIVVEGWITNSTTAGTAQLQWAQNTATAENTVAKKGSFLELKRVS